MKRIKICPVTFIELEDGEQMRFVTYPEVRQDMYQVTNHGRVFSNASGKLKEKAQHPVKEYNTTEMVRPIGDIRYPRPIPVHQLVAHEFLPPRRPEQTFINHKDGNTFNNHSDNLEFCTPSENNFHAIDHGLSKSGEDHHFNKYPESLIHTICKYMEDGYSNAEIREFLGVTVKDNPAMHNLIKDLRRRKVWRLVNRQYNY